MGVLLVEPLHRLSEKLKVIPALGYQMPSSQIQPSKVNEELTVQLFNCFKGLLHLKGTAFAEIMNM